MHKLRQELEGEIRSIESQKQNAGDNNYDNKMRLEKDASQEEQIRRRHDKSIELDSTLREQKQEQVENLEADLEDANNQFLSMTDLQELITEGEALQEQIETNKVEIAFK